jgi:hypothetical protein
MERQVGNQHLRIVRHVLRNRLEILLMADNATIASDFNESVDNIFASGFRSKCSRKAVEQEQARI